MLQIIYLKKGKIMSEVVNEINESGIMNGIIMNG